MPASSSIKAIAVAAITVFAASSSAQATSATPATTSSSSFNWDSLISAADTSQTSFDLFTTNGSLGPGVLDTSSRIGLFSSATPVVGPIGNGTVANGTATNGTTTGGSSAGLGGGTTTGGAASGSTGASGTSSESATVSAPAESGNAAVASTGLWVEGAGLLVGLGALMAAL